MIIQALRASTVNTYKDCPWKYYLQYVIGFTDVGSKKTTLGTICHHVWEILAKAKKVGHLKGKMVDHEYLLKICWARYTKQYEKDFKYEPADYKFCQKLCKTIAESKLNPLNLNVLAIEKQFEITVEKKGFFYETNDPISGEDKSGFAKLRGTIDLITEVGKDTIEVIDWKTGERKDWITGEPKDVEEFQKDQQVRMYDLALKHLYPQYKYRIFTVVYVRDGGPFTVTFTDAERVETLHELRKDFHKIKADHNPSRLKDDFGKKDKHWKCRYVCGFGKNKNEKGKSFCDVYKRLFDTNGYNLGTQKLYELSVKGKAIASRRNDYGHDKLAKLTIKQDDPV